MQKKYAIQKLTIAALLIAVGVVIPVFSPFKIMIEPASFTLASHVTIFIAMFMSPGLACAVSVGTTIGFFLGGFPLVIVFRAATHVIFSVIGALYLRKHPEILNSAVKGQIFSFVIAIIHAAAEVVAVSIFNILGAVGMAYFKAPVFITMLLLVGVGTVVHSMVDFIISLAVLRGLERSQAINDLFVTSKITK